LFVELTTEEDLRRWLPLLVGIERAVELRLADGSTVSSTPEAQHERQLTRETITASVHYVRFELSSEQVEAFAAGSVRLATDHPNYAAEVVLPEDTRTELLVDLRGG
jgi:hypothetical protein